MADSDCEGTDPGLEDADLDEDHHSSSSSTTVRPRDHCDYLLDVIDAQLSEMQAPSPSGRGTADSASYKYTAETSRTEHEEPRLCSSTQNKEASQAEQSIQEGGDSKKEQYKWRLKQLLGSEQTDAPGYQSDLNTTESVCTEDFITKFKEGMVDPQSDFSGEPSSDDGTPGCSPSCERSSKKTSEESIVEPESFLSMASTAEREADNEIVVLNTARRLDIVQQFKQDLESDLQGTVAEVEETPGTGLLSRNHRDSLESLGGRISRLSQSNTPDSLSILGKERSVAHSSVAYSSNPLELFRKGGSPSVISQKDNVKEPPCLSIGTNQETIHQETCGSPALKEMFPSCERSSVRGNGECRLGQENFTNGTNLSGSTYVSQSSTCSDTSVSMFKEKDALSRDRCPSPIKLSNEKENTSYIQEANGSDPEERNGNSCQPERKGTHREFGVVSISSFQQRTVSRSESCPYINGSSYRLEAANLLPESNHYSTTSGSRHIRSSSLSSRSSAAKGQFNSHRPSSPSSDRKIVSHRATAGINQKTCENFGSESSLNTIGTGEYVDSFQAVAVKHVAGVPVKSFDEVTIDSDLDSVKTDRVRKHFQKALSTRNGFASAKSAAADDLYSDQSDLDTAKLQQIERTFRDILRRKKSSAQGLKSVPVASPFGCRSTKRPRSPRKDACRFESSDRTVTDEEEEEEEEESLEQRFTESSGEWKTSSPVKWNSCPKRGGELSWGRSLGSEISEAHQRSSRLLDSDRQILEESVSRLRRDLAVEEETLSHRKAQVQEIEQSLTEALQKKKHAVQELESVKCAVEKSQKEARGLETRGRGSKSQAEEMRAELAVLEYKRDSCLQEVQTLEEELSVLRRQCSATHNSQQSTLQNQVSSLSAEREELRARLRLKEGSLSVLERQELERQLSCTRSELFTEQRSARDKISLLQEQLEDCQVEMEERATQEALLQERSRRLEQQLREMNRRQEEQTQKLALQSSEASQALSRQVQEASVQLLERDGKISALERILSEKELELLRLREGQATLQAERGALVAARETLTQAHQRQLQQLHRDKQLEEEQAKWQLKEELDLLKQQEIQQVREQAEEDKLEAVKHQALSFTVETEKLALKIQLKDEEIVKLKEAVRQQEVSMRKLAEELKLEAKEMVQGALLREHRKWETEKTEELQRQRGILEDESRRAVHSIKEDQERERRKALSLQNKVIELQTRVQELEFERRALQREKQEAVSEVRSSLREEKQEEILRVKEEMDQEKAREVERLRLRLEQEEAEVHRLRAGLGEAAQREKELQTQAERLERGAVLDLSLEYDRIQDLLHSTRERGAGASPARQRHSPSRLSLPQAVQALRGACEEQQQHILELHQELDTQRRTVLHIQRDKDRELQQQREELYLEKEAAVKSIKERLIQEHIEEISKLQRPLLKDSGGSECQSLRQQLREKDSELRAIQRNMTHWKDETAAKLACKFEEELNSELEKCKSDLLKQRRMSKNKPDHQRKIEKLESEMKILSVERSETAPLRSASTPSLSTAPPPGPQDFSTLKLLRHLQSRVKQLRAENTIYHPGSQDDLAGSYRETIRMTPERLPTRFKSSTRKPLM
ncbi:trichohyalin-like isoform X2 [Acipenser ruthenus]|uniref:trichohyalin-like isoform X2 n=1 Tax=Acipenser ruthenus TaxID=7906 RepID=UPI002741700C|nr:trichohyalin-like isoform X2 [Acipenser ruthenus]